MGDAWTKDKDEEEERQRRVEADRTRKLKEAMHKIDMKKSARKVQRWWRRIQKRKQQETERRRRVLKERRANDQKRKDDKRRQNPLYRVRRKVGIEPLLPSDDVEEVARKNMQVLMSNGITNKLYASGGKMKRIARAETRLPGLVRLRKGDRAAYTTEDMTVVLERGDMIRIGPTALYKVQEVPHDNNDEEEKKKKKKKKQKGEKEKEKEDKTSKMSDISTSNHSADELRPFNKTVIPLSDYWWFEDATMYIYFVQDPKEMLSCTPETALDVIENRKRKAWLLANPRKPNLKEEEAKRKAREEQKQKDEAYGMFESDKEKEKRLAEEGAIMKAKLNKLKNRAKMKAGGKKGRAQRMKSMKNNKAAALKLEAEENARSEAWRNSTDFDEDDD